MMTKEPVLDVAHLGHIELLTPKPEESLAFFINVLPFVKTEDGSAAGQAMECQELLR
jgi:catechol 2,3-dioxygenase-like lactoylglutathione lyase family enzyme